jgi:acetate kinase
MGDVILVINAGSSSLKFSVFDIGAAPAPSLFLQGQVEKIGTHPRLTARDATRGLLVERSLEPRAVPDHESAMAELAAWLRSAVPGARLTAAGHRVVHGGVTFAAPVLVDDKVLGRLDALTRLAPLHQPANLAGIRALRRSFPQLPQVACFDTAFHRGHPDLADRFAIPDELYEEGVRRYGFHGLSYEYIVQRLPGLAPREAAGRVIVCHLGSGASMCAIKSGRSLDSTMGFTALDGLPMGTRCGALDPGVVTYLIREKRMSADEVEKLLYNHCGLRGLSGISNDVRDLLESRDPAATLALEYFTYHVARQLGSLAAVLEGLDGIVFTAGIGEHSPEIRARICRRAAWLGLRLDDNANRANEPCISARDSAVTAWVIPTNEEAVIAQHTAELVRPLAPALIPS